MTHAYQAGTVYSDDGESAVYTEGDGTVIHYKRFNGVYYNQNTPFEVVKALDDARRHNYRIRLHYGETDSNKPDVGRDWHEELFVTGYVRISTEPPNVPVLRRTQRSTGGAAILDHCIVRIRRKDQGNATIYQHSTYKEPTFTIRAIRADEMWECGPGDLSRPLVEMGYTHTVEINGASHANFKSLTGAQRYYRKMTGKAPPPMPS